MSNKNDSKLFSLVIQDASEEDIADILSIQSQRIIDPEAEKEKQKIEETGFLVYPISAEDLKDLIKDSENHVVKVTKKENKTVGYLVSYDMKEWEATHPDWLSRFHATDKTRELIVNEKILYGRHIAVDKNAVSSGVGRKLLGSTLQEAKDRGYKYFIVEILREPITNSRSIRFVLEAGFKLIGQLDDQENRKWSVFLKDTTLE